MKEKKEALKLSGLIENLSHELRTPLNAILGYSELLKKSDNLNEEEQRHLEKIEASGGRLLDVINDIVEISSIEKGHVAVEIKPVDLTELASEIRNSFGAMARMKNLDLIVTASGHQQVHTDPEKLRIAAGALVSNAINFTQSGSVQVDMQVNSDTKKLEITVTDSGAGIAEEDLPKIYKPFWRKAEAEEKGTGLGLTICKKLVSLMHGNIHVLSFYGEGSRFKLQVPVGIQQSSSGTLTKKSVSAVSVPEANEVRQHPTVLVVDDMPINRTLARIMLESRNCQVLEAENGEQSVSLFQQKKPDLVLMDISMPVMDGVTAMEQIRACSRKNPGPFPIIAVTAGGHTGTRRELLQKGFSEYIQKPFKEKELIQKIQHFLPAGITESQQPPKTMFN